jgi:ATP-dependent DNA helicase RecQ
LRRADVDELTAALQKKGYKAKPYHAGLGPEQRQTTQNAFAKEECDLIVATVAFGMGIDRSNIRFVLHTAMPKSIEHYQQETGRAGRDGLEAECVLLHSGGDFVIWKSVLEKSAAEAGVDPSFLPNALKHLSDINRYCRGAVCRHRALVQYFGQNLQDASCAACDLCLGDTDEVPEATVVAQKILSCVARVQGSFGVGHIVSILRGENTEKVRNFNHDKLTTFSLLSEHSKMDVRDWIYQLIGQQVLEQQDLLLPSGEKVPILCLNDASWEVMRKPPQRTVRLLQSVRRKKGERPEKSRSDTISWEGVDKELFEALREIRRKLAEERQVPPYIIFNDSTLRQLAGIRPSTLERMRTVSGIGDMKLRDFGERFLQIVLEHCRSRGLSMDNKLPAVRVEVPAKVSTRPNPVKDLAFDQFRQGTAVEDVMHQTNRGRSTVNDYLCDFIRTERPAAITPWISNEIYERVAACARQVGTDRLKPIFLGLGEKISYDDIRIVLAHLASKGPG